MIKLHGGDILEQIQPHRFHGQYTVRNQHAIHQGKGVKSETGTGASNKTAGGDH